MFFTEGRKISPIRRNIAEAQATHIKPQPKLPPRRTGKRLSNRDIDRLISKVTDPEPRTDLEKFQEAVRKQQGLPPMSERIQAAREEFRGFLSEEDLIKGKLTPRIQRELEAMGLKNPVSDTLLKKIRPSVAKFIATEGREGIMVKTSISNPGSATVEIIGPGNRLLARQSFGEGVGLSLDEATSWVKGHLLRLGFDL